MKRDVLNVAGMTCGGCVTSVTRALTALPGVTGVTVSLPRKQVEVQYDEGKTTTDAMRRALQTAGYSIGTAPAVTSPARGGCCGA